MNLIGAENVRQWLQKHHIWIQNHNDVSFVEMSLLWISQGFFHPMQKSERLVEVFDLVWSRKIGGKMYVKLAGEWRDHLVKNLLLFLSLVRLASRC